MIPSLDEMLAQHARLEADLVETIAHPASTDAEIAAIKRKKLKLKDEIAERQRGSKLAA